MNPSQSSLSFFLAGLLFGWGFDSLLKKDWVDAVLMFVSSFIAIAAVFL